MFTDVDYEVVNLSVDAPLVVGESVSASVQTRPFKRRNVKIQTRTFAFGRPDAVTRSTQTEDCGSMVAEDVDEVKLMEFLNKIVPQVEKNLTKNTESRAFDCKVNQRVREFRTFSQFFLALEATFASGSPAKAVQHKLLRCPKAHLHAMSLSWNSTGNIVAVGYGRTDACGWGGSEGGGWALWNVHKQESVSSDPDVWTDVSSYVTCVAFHPNDPSLLATGSYLGDVQVWDVSSLSTPLRASSKTNDAFSHREQVLCMEWVFVRKDNSYFLLSSSTDGKILLWSLSNELQSPIGAYYVGDLTHPSGVTAFSFTEPVLENAFVSGTESGGLYRCVVRSVTTSSSASTVEKCSQFSYSGHSGPVYGLACSHQFRNVFLSASFDGSLRLYGMLEPHPLLTLEPTLESSSLLDCEFSPTRGSVFAASCANGIVYVYDISCSDSKAVLELSVDESVECLCVKFNRLQSEYMASGYGDGSVVVWRLGGSIVDSVYSLEETTAMELLFNR